MKCYSLFIFLILFYSIISESEYDNYKCNPIDTNENIGIGDTVTLCIHIPELKKRTVFKIETDKYTLVSIKDGYNKIISQKDDKPEPEPEKEEEKPYEKEDVLRRLVEEDTIKEQKQVVAQIGNVTTKFPSVNIILFHFLYRFIID